ncbi:cobalt ECF transporter T component CbiQ, partial [Streptomyces ficellus]|nr:cobalt ECF transporter T component CbiQ [Streptomyces ficellus]
QTGLAGRGYDGTLRVLVPPATVSGRFLGATGALLAGLVAVTLVLERLLP